MIRFTVYDATWPDSDTIAQGSAVMVGNRCVEYQVWCVSAADRAAARAAYDDGQIDYEAGVDYTLDPPADGGLAIVIHDEEVTS